MARSVSSQLRYTEFKPHLKSQIFGLKSWIHFKKTQSIQNTVQLTPSLNLLWVKDTGLYQK